MNGLSFEVNDFTWTTWYLDIIRTLEIEFPDNFSWIQSLIEFKHKYSKKNWKIDWHYNTWLEFLNSLKQHLEGIYNNNVDPIKYLYFLYSEDYEWLSINDIHRRVWSIWQYQNKDTLRRFLKNILGWELRESNERTAIEIKKAKASKNMNWLKKNNEQKRTEAQKVFKTKILEIIEINELSFSKEKYISIISKREKNIYLIAILLWIYEWEVLDKIRLLNEVCWYRTIAEWLTQISNEKLIKITITKDDIKNLGLKAKSIS